MTRTDVRGVVAVVAAKLGDYMDPVLARYVDHVTSGGKGRLVDSPPCLAELESAGVTPYYYYVERSRPRESLDGDAFGSDYFVRKFGSAADTKYAYAIEYIAECAAGVHDDLSGAVSAVLDVCYSVGASDSASGTVVGRQDVCEDADTGPLPAAGVFPVGWGRPYHVSGGRWVEPASRPSDAVRVGEWFTVDPGCWLLETENGGVVDFEVDGDTCPDCGGTFVRRNKRVTCDGCGNSVYSPAAFPGA